jgi:hypothetical protein
MVVRAQFQHAAPVGFRSTGTDAMIGRLACRDMAFNRLITT